jgi:DNA-binding CsgD family transcriptional regulator
MNYKRLTFFILLHFSIGLYGQQFYFYDHQKSLSISQIEHVDFLPIVNEINHGYHSGNYWLKLDYSDDNRVRIIQLANNHITQVKAYYQKQLIFPLVNHRFITYELSRFPVYLKVEVKKEAHIPVMVMHKAEFLKHEQQQLFLVGLFYGFALMVIIVNLFYYLNFQDKSFLYYALFLMSVIFSFGHRDGFMQILGMSKNITYYSEIFSHTLIGFVGTFFAVDYLQLKQNFPKFIYSLYFVVLVSLGFDVCYLLSDNFLCYILADLFVYYVFISCWFVSLLLFKKYSYAGYFCVAYGLLVAVVFAYFIAPLFAINQFNIDDNVLKIGSYVEMLIITFAVVVRMRILQDENQQMHDEIIAYTQQLNALSQGLDQRTKTKIDYIIKFNLSSRENEILALITQNKSNKEIARTLFISINTVKYHIKKLYQKLHIKNRKQVKSVLKPS